MSANDPGAGGSGHAPPPSAAPPHDGRTTATAPEPPRPDAPLPPSAAPPVGHRRRKRLLLSALGLVVLAAILRYGIPWLWLMFNTISTDDAYVNGHVTFVAPRVSGQVEDVLVDDNERVKQGALLVRLDKTPYQKIVAIKEAAVASASADVEVVTDQVRGMVALARSNRYKLQNAIDNVNNQIALLQSRVAVLKAQQPVLVRAQDDYQRVADARKLNEGAFSKEELQRREQVVLTARANVEQALADVYQIRASLGLPMKAEDALTAENAASTMGFLAVHAVHGPLLAVSALQRDDALAQVPANIEQTHPAVRQALAELIQSAAPLGVKPVSYDATPKQVIEDFYKRDPQGNLDRIYAEIIRKAPSIELAKRKLDQAQRDLDQANLNLSYCDVYAEIDGVVTRRNVNIGNNVQAGQSLMAVRSLTEIWIDANFKETQLADLRIGQRVRVEVDMYGSKREYEGRITGFTMGTGQTLSLLPPQNATGNFVKIVQRLPVRVELTDYKPEKAPLFVGLSVTPYVYYKEPVAGPHAGEFLQPPLTLPQRPPDQKQ
jgi:membrane fusion protein (multidrug efflux system)